MACRRGFTIIEILVALVLLDVGLLALVGASAAITRNSRVTRTGMLALTTAVSRLERLASTPCGADRSGMASGGNGITESWTETTGRNETRTLADSVRFPTSRASEVIVLTMGARC